MPWVEEKKGRVTRTFRCKGYFAGKGALGADTSETPLLAVNVTSLFYDHFYFGKRIGEKTYFVHLEHAGEGEVRPGEEGRGEGHGRGVAGTRSASFNGWDTGRH